MYKELYTLFLFLTLLTPAGIPASSLLFPAFEHSSFLSEKHRPTIIVWVFFFLFTLGVSWRINLATESIWNFPLVVQKSINSEIHSKLPGSLSLLPYLFISVDESK